MSVTWLLFLMLSWNRISHYADLCHKFCQRGFRIGEEPETWTLIQFGTNYLLFLIGQALANVHIALVYCPTTEKQILFSSLITLWMLPVYTCIFFSRYLFQQFARTLIENFKQLRHDIGEKSKQVILIMTHWSLRLIFCTLVHSFSTQLFRIFCDKICLNI